VIRAAAWFNEQDCGVYAPAAPSFQKSPPGESSDLVERPVKYYSRMTGEARYCLGAAALARRAVAWNPQSEIGSLASGEKGVLTANREFFQDYVANGRSLGRGNLFIYTLPTSALGEVAIALGLSGPCMFWRNDMRPIASMVQQAERLCTDGEADGMLLFSSDTRAAVCLAVDSDQGPSFPKLPESADPVTVYTEIKRMILQT
jgi:hypothetical protein